jgi:hypothetical protein
LTRRSRARAEVSANELEGLAALLPRDTIHAQDPEPFFAMLRATCELPDLLGATLHFVCVARAGLTNLGNDCRRIDAAQSMPRVAKESTQTNGRVGSEKYRTR